MSDEEHPMELMTRDLDFLDYAMGHAKSRYIGEAVDAAIAREREEVGREHADWDWVAEIQDLVTDAAIPAENVIVAVRNVLKQHADALTTEDKLRISWCKHEDDVMAHFPKGSQTVADGGYLAHAMMPILQELEQRGYDPHTIKFSIEPVEGNDRFASQRKDGA